MFKVFITAFILASLALAANCVQEVEVEEPKGSTVCSICTVVLSAAQSLLENNKTETEVLDFIEKNLCGRLGALNASCVTYVEAYGKTILYELSKKIDPSIVCQHLGLCEVAFIQPQPSIVKPMVNSLNCTLCKTVMGQVQKMLESNATEAQIVQLIEQKLCNSTGTMSKTCKSLIDTYGPTILAYLGKEIDPTKVCILIGMCSNSTSSAHFNLLTNLIHLVESRPKPTSNPTICAACEVVIRIAEKEVQGNKTETQIVSEMEKICSILPASMKTQCQSIIDVYGVYIIGLLVNQADPAKVCGLVKLC